MAGIAGKGKFLAMMKAESSEPNEPKAKGKKPMPPMKGKKPMPPMKKKLGSAKKMPMPMGGALGAYMG